MKCFLTVFKKPLQSKVLLVMKLTALLTLFFTLNVSANGFGQDKISLRVKKTEISEVLRTIEKQTSYRFLYNAELEDIRERVSLNVKEATIGDVLTLLLEKTRLLYQLMDNNLIVIKEDPGAPVRVPDAVIRGKITGDGGAPLAGASVLVKGTSNGTTTDNEGNFSLTVPDANVTLVISSVGYDQQEIALAGRTDITVALVVSTKVMDQVVVVGYGTQRRRQVTGAISSVSGDQIAKQPVLTAVQGLQGLAPGIRVVASGQPGVQPRVTIRGLNTILTDENPLYVVDGVLTDDITNVNTADIVSVEILKDGAAAIYGSRAANGVVLITTQRGKSGKPNVSFDSYVGFRKLINIVDMANSRFYAEYTDEARAYDAQPPIFDPDTIKVDTDWFDEISRKGLLQNHNVNINGGSDKVTYLFSAGYFGDAGVLKGANYSRISLRSNNEFRLTKFLKFGNIINVAVGETDGKPNSAFSNAYRLAPTVPVKFANGSYGFLPELSVGNPIADLELANDFNKTQRYQGSLYGEVMLARGLTFRSSWGFDRFNRNHLVYIPVFNYSIFNHSTSELFVREVDRTYWVWDNILTYSKKFGDHNISLMAGHTAEKDRGKSIRIRGTNVPPERNLWYLTQGDPTITLDTDDPDYNRAFNLQRRSMFARLNYSFQDKYNFSGVLRRDGSSAFPDNRQWGTFYSLAGSWIVSDEAFMDNVKSIDHLKVRLGYAELGNDGISRLINNELSQLQPVTLTNPYGLPGGLVAGITFDQIRDAQASWETTKGIDAGIEFGFLNRRLTGEVSYYNKKTNTYIRVPTPPFVDPDGILSPAADIRNKGVELGLAWNDKAGNDFEYRIGFNATFNKNNVEEVRGGIDLAEGGLGNGEVTTYTVKGQPIGSFWVYQTEGIYQTQAEINGSPHFDGTRPGDFRYTDINKDGSLDTRDRIFVGSYQPKFYYGISGGIKWKQIDFSVDCYGNAGNKVYNGKKGVRFGNENIEASREDRWTPTNPSTTEPRASNQIPKPSTYFVESGSFFRINNITIGYTIPASLADKAFMSSARIFVSAQNPLISKKFSGFSPELPRTNALNSGIELDVYPTLATYMIGININFK